MRSLFVYLVASILTVFVVAFFANMALDRPGEPANAVEIAVTNVSIGDTNLAPMFRFMSVGRDNDYWDAVLDVRADVDGTYIMSEDNALHLYYVALSRAYYQCATQPQTLWILRAWILAYANTHVTLRDMEDLGLVWNKVMSEIDTCTRSSEPTCDQDWGA